MNFLNVRIKRPQAFRLYARRFFETCTNILDTHPLYILSLILVLAVILSVRLNLESLPLSMSSGENDSWWAISLNLIHGHGYSLCLPRYFPFCGPTNQVTAAREPLPVLLFALVAYLSNESLMAASGVELLLFLAVLVTIYFLTREWANTKAALLAAFLWAIYIPAIELIPQVSGDLLAALLVCLAIFAVMRARKTDHIRDWLMGGLCLGLAAISRSGTLMIGFVLIMGITLESWKQRSSIKKILLPGLVISSFILLAMGPWLIRNKMALGRSVLGSSLVGYNLYRHNYMIGTNNNYFRYVGGEEGLKAIDALLVRRTDLRGTENEAQMDLIYRGEALKIIRAHPIQYGLLSIWRFLPLWFNWTYFESYGLHTAREDYWIMVFQGMLLVFMLIGLRSTIRRAWPLWGSILVLVVIYMVVDSQLLYLTPIMPLAISLSAAAIIEVLTERSTHKALSIAKNEHVVG